MKFGVMFDFRNPAQWHRPDPALYKAQLDEIARLDELGYDNIWLTEHHFVEDGYNPSVLPLAAAIAVRTSRMRVGKFVLLLPFHNPVRVAEDAIAVDILSNGRFDLGVGQGYRAEEFAALKIPRAERSARLDEAIDLIHRLFTEREVSFEGKYNRVAGMTLYPRRFSRVVHRSGSAAGRPRRPNAPRGWGFICSRLSGPIPRSRTGRRSSGSGAHRGISTSRSCVRFTSPPMRIGPGTRRPPICTT